ncbi:MAG TPA: PIG-L family deacetylase [Acidimicrobiia bacterium]|nr:PIG-L family deacetylase [Acidimicrobiia bacterium]
MTNYLFLHAHPDDEVTFSGGLIKRLADQGHTITVVFATDDEERRKEAINAAKILGVTNVEFLGYGDSGFGQSILPEDAFARCLDDDKLADEAVQRLLLIISKNEIDEIYFYDENGIYPHLDHLTCHHIGTLAMQTTGKNASFITVDREQLHYLVSKEHAVQQASTALAKTESTFVEDILSEHDLSEQNSVDELLRTHGLSRQEIEWLKKGRGREYGSLGMDTTRIMLYGSYIELTDHELQKKFEAWKAHSSQTSQFLEALTDPDDPTTYNDDFREIYGIECITQYHVLERSIHEGPDKGRGAPVGLSL